MEIEVTRQEYKVAIAFYETCASDRGLGEKLHLGTRTVNTCMGSLLLKTGTRNRCELWAWLNDNKLIPCHGRSVNKLKRLEKTYDLINKGHTIEDIAQHMNIAPSTIRKYKREPCRL